MREPTIATAFLSFAVEAAFHVKHDGRIVNLLEQFGIFGVGLE